MERELRFQRVYKGYGYSIGSIQFREWGPIWKDDQTDCFNSPPSIGGHSPIDDRQYSGLKDRNDIEIWEGDLVNYAVKKRFCNCKAEKEINLGIERFCPSCGKKVEDTDFITTAEIKYHNGSFVFYKEHPNDRYSAWNVSIAEMYIAWKEVIGNIWENPELLK